MALGRCVESLVGTLCVGRRGELPTTRQFRDRLPGSDSDVWYEDQS